jgi:hypothetical protein
MTTRRAWLPTFARRVAGRQLRALRLAALPVSLSLVAAFGCDAHASRPLADDVGTLGSARLLGLTTRPAVRRAEVALLLQEVQAVAARVTRVGAAHAQGHDVRALAQQVDAELAQAANELARNCTAERAESAPWESAALHGQDILRDLASGSADQFDRRYLYGVISVGVTLDDLLENSAEPAVQTPESAQLASLRQLLTSQRARAEALLGRLL